MRAKFILEKFIEESDPIRDMGIGIETLINNWLKTLSYIDLQHTYNKHGMMVQCITHNKPEFFKYFLEKSNLDFPTLYAWIKYAKNNKKK